MASEIPVVRHFIACREIVVQPDSQEVTLRNVVHAVVRLPGEPLPCLLKQICLYTVLTNGQGRHELITELKFFDREQGVERLQRRMGPKVFDFGQDPTVVHGLPIRWQNVIFDKAGQYTFYLLCNGQPIAQEFVEVR